MTRAGVIFSMLGVALLFNRYILNGGGRRIGFSLLAIGVCFFLAQYLVGERKPGDE